VHIQIADVDAVEAFVIECAELVATRGYLGYDGNGAT